jgi:hypothetical protein
MQAYSSADAPSTPRGARIGVTGVVLTSVGALVSLAGTFAAWYDDGGHRVFLYQIVHAAKAPGADALPRAYFGAALWLLLAATIAVSMLASVPGRLTPGLRVLSPLLGALAVVLTYSSLTQLVTGARVFDHAALGLWLVLAGWLITGLAGAAGPRR